MCRGNALRVRRELCRTLGPHLPCRLLAHPHCGCLDHSLWHQCPGVDGGHQGQHGPRREGWLLAHLQAHHYRLCPQLRHSGRRLGRRALPHHGAEQGHFQAARHFFRHPLRDVPRLCALLVLVHVSIPLPRTLVGGRPSPRCYGRHRARHHHSFLLDCLLPLLQGLQVRTCRAAHPLDRSFAGAEGLEWKVPRGACRSLA